MMFKTYVDSMENSPKFIPKSLNKIPFLFMMVDISGSGKKRQYAIVRL